MSEFSGLKGDSLEEDDFDQIGSVSWPPWRNSRYQYIIELILLASGIGLVIGCALSMISLTPVLSGSTASSGALYGAFTLSCIPAPFFVKKIGSKWGLFTGCMLYVGYAVGSRFSAITPLYMVASIMGGVGSTILWTSQGAYLTTIAEAHALSSGQVKDASLGVFNGVFVAIFQFGIVSCQLLSSFVLPINQNDDGTPSQDVVNMLYDIYASLVGLGAILILLLPTHALLFQKRVPQGKQLSFLENLTAPILLLMADPRMALMIFSNMGFGFQQGFQNGAWYGEIVGPVLASSKIGFVSAITSGTGALIGYPLGKSVDIIGTTPIMCLGFVCHMTAFIIILSQHGSYDPDSDGLWLPQGWQYIAPVSFLFGVGNAVWNSTNSAIFGKFFNENKEAAFANLKFWSGLATALMLLVFNHHCKPTNSKCEDPHDYILQPIGQIYLTMAVLCMGIVGYFFAFRLHQKKTSYDAYSIQN